MEELLCLFQAGSATPIGLPLPLSSTMRLGNSTTTQKPGEAFDRVTTITSYPDSKRKVPNTPLCRLGETEAQMERGMTES